jgi:hypothetical protein
MKKNYSCYSGGADGADITWENEGEKYGIITYSYSFENHNQKGKNQIVLNKSYLDEGHKHVLIANENLKRNINKISPYVKNLLSRNWYQIKNSDAIFAIGEIKNTNTQVDGGTGWAIQMGIDNKKPIFVFDQERNSWYEYNYSQNQFEKLNSIPTLTENFAGIGTRDIRENGINAIKEIYSHNLT